MGARGAAAIRRVRGAFVSRAPAVPPSLSPSRAGDFIACALMFRYRTIDRLVEPSSPEAVRGTLVHQVLEEIFDLPAATRTPQTAHAMVEPTWRALIERDPRSRRLASQIEEESWLASAHEAIDRWFALEDPTRLEPSEREVAVEATLPSGLRLRGIIDRLDQAPDGALRVVDYKTSSAVPERHEARALFQLRFYALILWLSRGELARVIQLVYLGPRSEIVSYEPDVEDLGATQRKIEAIAAAIDEGRRTGTFEPNPGPQCDWCAFKAHCPAFGGTLLPMPRPRPASPWQRIRSAVQRRWRASRTRHERSG